MPLSAYRRLAPATCALVAVLACLWMAGRSEAVIASSSRGTTTSLATIAGASTSARRPRCVGASKHHKPRHNAKSGKSCRLKKRKGGSSGSRRPSQSLPGPADIRRNVSESPVLQTPGASTLMPSESSTLEDPLEPGTTTGPSEAAKPGEPAPFRFFAKASFWNVRVPADAPLDPSSAAIVGAFDEELASEGATKEGPATINSSAWSVPIYTVPAGQPMVTVKLQAPAAGPSAPALRSAWSAVPLPANAQAAAGTDGHLAVWQPSTDRLWEFWRLVHAPEGWYASWGGAMQKVSSNLGVYGPEAWPGASPSWGGWASALSLTGGLITLEDLELGQINHALVIGIPNVRAGVYSSPARHDDGTSPNPLSLPEGAHLRLDPKLNLSALHLPRVTLMIAEAAQRYGIFITAKGANVAFFGQDPTPTGSNPYTGPGGYYEGKSPPRLLSSFPWNHLQLLKMELHSNRRGRLGRPAG